MNLFFKAGKVSILSLALGVWCLAVGANAQAQTTKPATPAPRSTVSSDDQGWHADITPYVWFAGVHGTVGALGHDASVHASFSDIFQYLNIGLMGAAEVRYNRIVMPLDFMWMKLSDDHGIPIDDVYSIKAKMTETMVTPKIGYRVASTDKVKVTALFGFRYWHLSNDLSLQPTQPKGSFSDSANWVDAVAGGNIAVWVTPKVVVTVLGDAGGGSARHDYQVAGGLGYKISRRWVLQAGYRYLSVNYRPNGHAQFVYDVSMPGMVLGATYILK